MTKQLTLQQEKEFFKLAGFMLLARFQVVNGTSCIEDFPGHSQDNTKLLYHQLSYLGYKDAIGEMCLLLKEVKVSLSSLPLPGDHI